MRFPESSSATRRPICPRPWPPWTAASKWQRDGRNSLINIRNHPNLGNPHRARIRLLSEDFVQCTKIPLDLLRCEPKLSFVVHRSKAAQTPSFNAFFAL